MIKRFAAALFCGAYLFSANAAFAETTSAVIDVTATVTAYCSVDIDGSLNFGDLSRDSDSAAATMVEVACNDELSPTMTIRGSVDSGPVYVMRKDDGSALLYGVKADGSNLGAGVPRQLNMSNGAGAESYVQFQIEAIVNVSDARGIAAGSYSDSLTVDLDY